MAAAVPGAIEGIRKLKAMGHTLFVLSSIGDEPDVLERRRRHLESIFGRDVFDDVICVARFDDKGKWLAETGADVLIDDGPANTTRAIECGVRAIWFHCPENDHMVKAVMSGGKKGGVRGHFWPFDAETLRRKAIVADGWPDAVKIIAEL
jgi:FMN phosphatase YigB (HAD superfamily)